MLARLCPSPLAARDLVAAGQSLTCSGAGLSQKDRKSGPVLKRGTVGCIWACCCWPSLRPCRRGISPLLLAACASYPACIQKRQLSFAVCGETRWMRRSGLDCLSPAQCWAWSVFGGTLCGVLEDLARCRMHVG